MILDARESINEAVIRAHRDGILTTASLMVNEAAAGQAVAHGAAKSQAGRRAASGAGLRQGRSAAGENPRPRGARTGNFPENAVAAGMRYFFSSKCRAQLRAEIEAQFEKFHATGLPLDHVNGHLHMHLHPVVLGILMDNARQWGIRAMRLTCDRFFLNARLASGQWVYRVSHAIIYDLLSARARPRLAGKKSGTPAAVFGLLQTSRVDSDYIEKLLPRLPPGDSELYSHPSLDQFRNEYDALVNPAIRRLLQQHGHPVDPLPGPVNMTKIILILIVAAIIESIGVAFLSGGFKEVGGAREITVSEIARVIKNGATNGKILAGIALEAVFFGASALHDVGARRELRVAADVAGFYFHDAGGAVYFARTGQRVALGGSRADRPGRQPD